MVRTTKMSSPEREARAGGGWFSQAGRCRKITQEKTEMTSSREEDCLVAGFDLRRVPREELDRRAAEEAREYMRDPIHSMAPLYAIKEEQSRRGQL